MTTEQRKSISDDKKLHWAHHLSLEPLDKTWDGAREGLSVENQAPVANRSSYNASLLWFPHHLFPFQSHMLLMNYIISPISREIHLH